MKYLGPVEPSQVLGTMRKYDALLIPTHCKTEGYPGVILEAYCAGIPVIATDWNAIGEIVENEESGLLVKPRCHNSLAEAMHRISQDTKLWSRLRAGAIRKRSEFSNAHWYQELMNHCDIER